MYSCKRIMGLCLSVLMLAAACTTVPVTGRQQLNIVSNSSIIQMSLKEYDDFLKKNKLSENEKDTRMVKGVGLRIQKAVERYFSERGMSHLLEGYKWEFNLVEGKDVNAWCMPGGKVVVYTGLLPVAQDEEGLAVVMGHEIAHAVANHGGERMSQGLIAQMGGIALAVAVRDKPRETQQLWMMAFGLGATVGVMLPYSRLHENEADELGLIFMAMAGYDPRKAIDFWERMAKKKGDKAPPELLSTHPSDQTRINNIKAAIPAALDYYKKPS
ncbi:MAG: M48 family metallopeptidase [Thermodesulfobacteriota bacterium]